MESDFLHLVRRLVPLPTAPYCEHFVDAEVTAFAAARPGLGLRRDAFGNLLLTCDGQPADPGSCHTLVVTAHMDHPGLVYAARASDRDFLFERAGGVPVDLARQAKVQIYDVSRPAAQKPVIGKLTAYLEEGMPGGGAEARNAGCFRVRVDPAVADTVGPGSFAVLDLPPLRVKDRRIRARACDDLVGVAVGLCWLHEAQQQQLPTRCRLLLTRAEETGLGGMLAAVRDGDLDRAAVYVNVECSSCSAGAPLGAGPIIRVGDRAWIFDPETAAGMQNLAAQLDGEASDSGRQVRYQRRLMDGGVCEATVLARAGYATGAVALPLKNYHNQGRRRLRPEAVDLDDALDLVEILLRMANSPGGLPCASRLASEQLDATLSARYRQSRDRLRRTAAGQATAS